MPAPVRGAAFEYTFNVEHELHEQGVRELADVVYLSNEYDLGDFGVGGMSFAQNGFVASSKMWTESLFRDRGVRAILRAHVERVDPGCHATTNNSTVRRAPWRSTSPCSWPRFVGPT